jgi:tetratricopeptide (TPR) repeat protein
MLREALIRRAKRGGTWTRWNRAAAAMLGDDPEGAEDLERAGRYRLEADAAEGALELLYDAAEAWQARGVPRRALALLDLRRQAIARAGLPDDDERHGLGPALRARIHRFGGELDEALRWARRAERGALEHGWARVGALAALRVAQVAHLRGEREASAQGHGDALPRLRALGLDQPAAEAEQALADLAFRAGHLDAADAGFARAAAAFSSAGDAAGEGNCLRARALVARKRGDRAAADRWIEAALASYADAGHLSGRADCLNTRAELDREAGRLAAAEAGYAQAVELQDAVGAAAAGVFPRVNLGLVLLARQRWAEADVPLARAEALVDAAGRRGVLGCVLCFRTAADAGQGRWGDADARLARARAALDEAAVAEEDVAWSLAIAAELAAAEGRRDLAIRCLRTAAEQWRRLGRTEPRDEVLERLRSLG